MIIMALTRRAQSWLAAVPPNGATDSKSVASKSICIGVLRLRHWSCAVSMTLKKKKKKEVLN